MAKKHIERYLSVFSNRTVCLHIFSRNYLIIYRIQDVYEPWLALIKKFIYNPGSGAKRLL
jgi:hypothetical protein